MKTLKFELSGDFAFFKIPDINSNVLFSYGQIHKVALIGMIGATLGLGGYSERGNDAFPEFYSKLKDLPVAIIPRNEGGYIEKYIHTYNNSTGHASREDGGNLIVTEQLLLNPKWIIYIGLKDDELSKNIEKTFATQQFKFIPYLGKNDCFADIQNIEILDLEEVEDVKVINSIYYYDDFEIKAKKISRADTSKEYFYKEDFPIGLSSLTNHYIMKLFAYTNKKVKKVNSAVTVFRDNKAELNMCFI
ncbi:MAG: type I-B CRISPR-associated protein Cas5b [Clostridia bacterium]